MARYTCTHVEPVSRIDGDAWDGTTFFFYAEISGRRVGIAVNADVLNELVEINKTAKHSGHAAWHWTNKKPVETCSECQKGR